MELNRFPNRLSDVANDGILVAVVLQKRSQSLLLRRPVPTVFRKYHVEESTHFLHGGIFIF